MSSIPFNHIDEIEEINHDFKSKGQFLKSLFDVFPGIGFIALTFLLRNILIKIRIHIKFIMNLPNDIFLKKMLEIKENTEFFMKSLKPIVESLNKFKKTFPRMVYILFLKSLTFRTLEELDDLDVIIHSYEGEDGEFVTAEEITDSLKEKGN